MTQELSKSKATRVVLVADTRNAPFKCSECGKVFITEAYLENHVQRRHKTSGIPQLNLSEPSGQPVAVAPPVIVNQAAIESNSTLDSDGNSVVEPSEEFLYSSSSSTSETFPFPLNRLSWICDTEREKGSLIGKLYLAEEWVLYLDEKLRNFGIDPEIGGIDDDLFQQVKTKRSTNVQLTSRNQPAWLEIRRNIEGAAERKLNSKLRSQSQTIRPS